MYGESRRGDEGEFLAVVRVCKLARVFHAFHSQKEGEAER